MKTVWCLYNDGHIEYIFESTGKPLPLSSVDFGQKFEDSVLWNE
jgi:hypothetical protein